MKKLQRSGAVYWCALKKTFWIMRLVVLFLLTGILQVSALNSYSQQARMSMKLKNVRLADVLNEIENQSDYYFLYNQDLIDVDRKVNLDAKEQTVEVILKKLFGQTNTEFLIRERQIILTNLSSDAVAQQTKRVSGKITDSSNQPIPGVTVIVKGTTQGTVSDFDGNYTLDHVPADGVLSFSFVGMRTQEVVVGTQSTINVTMAEDAIGLEEVVAIGYGVQKKVNLTGSVATVSAEEIEKNVTANTVQALQGKIAGVTINDLGGSPGNQKIRIRIRGNTTLSEANSPLVLVDGVERSLGDIDPNDIQSYNVLKDASSTAIYGSRAAAGVILITTKSGKAGDKLSVDYNYSYTLQKVGAHPESIGLKDYLDLQVLSYGNNGRDGEAAVMNILDRNSKFDSSDPAYGGDINKVIAAYEQANQDDPYSYPTHFQWYDVLFDDAPMQKHAIAVSGGTEHIKGRLAANTLKQDGIMPLFNFDRKNISTSLTFDYGRLFMTMNASSLIREDKRPASASLHYVMHGTLWTVPKFEDGSYGGGDKNRNPLLWMEKGGDITDRISENILNWKGEYELLKGLSWSTQISYKEKNYKQEQFQNKGEYFDKLTGRKISGFDPVHNSYSLSSYKERQTDITNLLRYGVSLDQDKHNIELLVGHNDIYHQYEAFSAGRRDFYNNDLRDLDLGVDDETKTNSSGMSEWGLRSFFGRATYNYQQKYLFEANVRVDGSSKFPEDNRFGTFPSFSAGWRLSEEPFWDEVVPTWADNFKLRGSWGQVGTQSIKDFYSYFPALNKASYPIGGNAADAYYQGKDPNNNLQWETTTQWNIGVDAGFLDSRMNLIFDYYNKTTEGILLTLPVPGVIGLNPNFQNAGIVSNKGWELALSYASKTESDFTWDATFSLAYNKNTIEDLAGTGFYPTSAEKNYRVNKEGLPMNSLYGFKVNRTYQPEDFNAEGILKPEFARPKDAKVYPGDLMYEDINGDGQITKDGDATFLGSIFPDYTYGLTLNGQYKSFDLNVFFQGVEGANAMLQGAIIEGGNWEGFTIDMAKDYWTEENPGARFPRPDKKGNKNTEPSSWWIIDASYFKLKNVQLGYTIPKSLCQRVNLSKVRVFASASNVFFLSESKDWGIDPEVENEYSGRLSYYPQTRQFTFGVNVNF